VTDPRPTGVAHADQRGGALRPPSLRVLPLGQLRPAGWLGGQLALQADGMAGHLDEVWPDVGDSAWIGGDADGWERGPYWLDGVVPLAFLRDDARLRAKVDHWVAYILDHQDDDGWFGPRPPRTTPEQETVAHFDVWPRVPLLKALLQYHEATGDERIVAAALRFAGPLAGVLVRWPLRDWGRARWADLAWCLHQLYDLTGEPWLLDLAETLHTQGYDWMSFAADLRYKEKVDEAMLRRFQDEAGGVWMNDNVMASHGVNVAMGLKMPAVWWRQGGDGGPATLDRFLDQLDSCHGQASGLYSADEHLAGPHPSQGTETCAVVEMLFSLEVALEVWGLEESLVDRLERVAYNALPAAATPDEWGHQYVQQANQVRCAVTPDRLYTNNGPDANTFGLEPHFGCCTANRHQGWPKFAARLWMASPDGGLAALSYAPCTIDTTMRGVPVHVEVGGDYPFSDEVSVTIRTAGPVDFPLRLRVPGWAEHPTLTVAGAPPDDLTPGTVHEVRRTWQGETRLALRLPARPRVEHRRRGCVSVHRGPLVFALEVGEDWHQIGGETPHADWAVNPSTPWNYALALDPAHPDAGLVPEQRPVGSHPFSPDAAPIVLHAAAARVPGWRLAHGAADLPPASPVTAADLDADLNAGTDTVELKPYGCVRLRVTELPWTTDAASLGAETD
jgi:uncharacterized protein